MEWPLEYYTKLVEGINKEKFKIFITGSEKEKSYLAHWIEGLGDQVTDITGKFDLVEFIAFVSAADGLVASSTGPLHIAAATGIHALGLYTNTQSVNSTRWAPIGRKAEFIESQSGEIQDITPQMLIERIAKWKK